MTQLRRERFPFSGPDVIQISVSYPGASPEETEQSICLPVEAAIRPVAGIKKIIATAKEGSGSVSEENASDIEPESLLNGIALQQSNDFC